MVTKVQSSLAKKLNPNRFTAMSGKMAAIVAYILGEKWTDPAISDMAITSDGFLLAQHEGDMGLNDFMGAASDLDRNVANLIVTAELTQDEQAEWQRLYKARITDWRR